ncbi:acyltransferase [Vibrio maritimus]|uniref:acyltransferase n=1 Tax=Vibrio maritimus TaxID=990268 RepID=UPI003735368B
MQQAIKKSEKIASFELARVIALVAIISIHCQLLMDYGYIDEEPWLNFVTNQAARFAVPLFFLIAGYLIYPKLNAAPYKTAKDYCIPLMVIWLVWSIIHLVLPFNLGVVAEHGYLAERQGYWQYLMQAPLNSLFEGGLVHLWFIPSLAIAVLMIAWFVDNKCRRLIIPFAAIIYVYGLIAGSYGVITEVATPIFTRNGPFFSFLMVAIGFEARRNNWSMSATIALLVAAAGMLLHFAEAYYLHGKGQIFNMNDFLLGTAIWATGLFFFLLAKPNLGNQPIWLKLGQWVLPIYVVHLLVVIYMNNLVAVLELQTVSADLVIFFGTLVGSVILMFIIEKTPISFAKLRSIKLKGKPVANCPSAK